MENLAELGLIIAPDTLPNYYRLEQFEAILTRFSEQEAQRPALDLNVDIEYIRNRYNTEKSIFSKLTDYYVSLNWWTKLLLGFLVIGVGSLLNISIWVSVVCYIGLIFLFFEHTQKNHTSQARVSEEVRQLKAELMSTISHTDAIKLSMLQIMRNIRSLNIELAQFHAIHQAQIQELNYQIESGQKAIQNLTITTQSLTHNLSSYKEELEKHHQLIRQHEQTLAQKSRALEEIHMAFGTEVSAIKAIRIKLEEKYTELSRILEVLSAEPQKERDPMITLAQAALESSAQINATANQLIHQETENFSVAPNSVL